MLFNISLNYIFVFILVVLMIRKIDSTVCNIRVWEKHWMSQWLVILKRQFVSFKICKKVDPKRGGSRFQNLISMILLSVMLVVVNFTFLSCWQNVFREVKIKIKSIHKTYIPIVFSKWGYWQFWIGIRLNCISFCFISSIIWKFINSNIYYLLRMNIYLIWF